MTYVPVFNVETKLVTKTTIGDSESEDGYHALVMIDDDGEGVIHLHDNSTGMFLQLLPPELETIVALIENAKAIREFLKGASPAS